MLRLGHIPYLNCEPFFAFLSGYELHPLTPHMLGRAMAEGVLDAGPLALVDFLDLERSLIPLPFGIATRDGAQSVLVFSHRPLDQLDGAVVGVTEETSTSVQLLKLLLALRYVITPRAWVGPDDPCDAVLLIGDPAIRELKGERRWSRVTDLGSEWVSWTGLPCVFARWGVRRSVPDTERLALGRALDQALDHGLAALAEIAGKRRDTGFTEAEVKAYLRAFTYRLGAEEEKAIAEFARLRAFLRDGQC